MYRAEIQCDNGQGIRYTFLTEVLVQYLYNLLKFAKGSRKYSLT